MDISDNNTYVKSDILLCHYLQCVGSRKISDRYGDEWASQNINSIDLSNPSMMNILTQVAAVRLFNYPKMYALSLKTTL